MTEARRPTGLAGFVVMEAQMNMKLFWTLVIGGCLFPPLWIVAVFMLVVDAMNKKPKEQGSEHVGS